MIDIIAAKDEFKKYVSNYDMNNPKIKLKYYHSIRVSKICKKISISLGLSKEEIKLMELAGLLHDMGRFEQIKVYNTFKDSISIDHAEYGVKVLFENDLIRKFVLNDKYDEIIKATTLNHSKYKMLEGYSKEVEKYINIVRDADKLDILFLIAKRSKKNYDGYLINTKIKEKIINKEEIKNEYIKTPIDELFAPLSYIYDINYVYTFKVINKNHYISKIIRKQHIKDKTVLIFLDMIKKDVKNYKELLKRKEI